MMMNRTKAMDAEYPIFHQRNPSQYIYCTTLNVRLNGPPCVMIYGSANNWKNPIMVMTPINKVVGASIGIVMDLNCCQQLAPSIRAASYSCSGMFCNPAIKIIMLYPKFFQTDIRIMAGMAHWGSPSQSMCSIPAKLNK